jgi:hypothetical protein
MTEGVFRREGDTFVPSRYAASPWTADGLHGGPPSGLLAYGLEQANPDPRFELVRFTLDLFRAVPQAPLRIVTRVVRQSRRLAVLDAELVANGEMVSRASGLFLARQDVAVEERVRPARLLDLDRAGPPGPFGEALNGRPRRNVYPVGFHSSIEGRAIEPIPGMAGVWVRIPMPFIAGEETTPLARVGAIADFANAVGSSWMRSETSFINADITITLHRQPEGEWIALTGRAQAEPTGIAVTQVVLHDRHGPVGFVIQSLLANEHRRLDGAVSGRGQGEDKARP